MKARINKIILKQIQLLDDKTNLLKREHDEVIKILEDSYFIIKEIIEKEIEKAKFDSGIFFCRNFKRYPLSKMFLL